MAAPIQTRLLLLIEDNPGDANMVSELLSQGEREAYQVIHAQRMSEAVGKLKSMDIDVIVLDLRLPDCHGVESIKSVRKWASQIPIVVLTGSEDEQLALSCIDAGAQDYLTKAEVRAQNLKRAIGYAVSRVREAQVRELQQALDHYRALSSAAQGTTVTAALAGSGAIAMRSPETFDMIVHEYINLLEPYQRCQAGQTEAPRDMMERVVTRIGDANGGPRDLVDVHVAALDHVLSLQARPQQNSVMFEARLLALEMMGLLVDYYRVGHRRRFI